MKNRIGRIGLSYWCLGACAVALGAAPALAQNASAGSPGDKPAASAEGFEEILVTAQRREQSAQAVPISITALGSRQLEATGIVSLPQIAQLTPGLQFQSVGSSSVPFLRGVGSTSTIIGSEAATAIYVDGVYISNQSVAYMSLPNIQSVEIAKGPQGTLFGRNATAGVIQITTRKPTSDPTAEIRVGYANYDTLDGTFYGSTGLGSGAAIDLTVSHTKQNDGWGTNLFDGSEIYKRSDMLVRSRLAVDLSDKTDITFSGDYEKIKGQTGFANRAPRPGELGPAEAGIITGFVFNGGFYDANYNFPSFSETETYGLSMDARHHFGGVDLRSITAYRRTDVYQSIDFDFAPGNVAALVLPIRDKTFSQEVQLLSREGSDSKLSWILGAFYYFQDARYVNSQQSGILFTLPPALAGTPSQIITLNSQQKTNSYAAFGQGTYAATDKLNLTLGARYTSDKRCIDATQTNDAFSTPLLPLTQRACKVFPKVTWRGVIDYKVANDVMVYAQYSRGFKSGFFNVQSLQSAPTAPRSEPLAVRPETLDAFEVGFKSEFMDRRVRLNASAFHYDYKDLQVNAFISAASRVTLNAASARINGLEGELKVRPAHGFDLSFSGTYLDAKYKAFPGAPAFTPRSAPPFGLAVSQINAAGKKLPNAPTFSGTATASYTLEAPIGTLTFSGSLYYNSGYFFDPENRLRQPEHALLNASIRWESPNQGYSLSLWGNNLTNRKLYGTVNPIASADAITPSAPRTYGVRIGVKF